MHTCAAICEIRREVNPAAGGAILLPGVAAVSVQMNLTAPSALGNGGLKTLDDFTSPVFDLIASAFVRYRVNKLIFHYEPQSAATATERLVFAFAEDPLHPVLWNATVPTQNSLLALSDSIAFAPWRSWSMDVTENLNQTLFYTHTDPSTTVAEFSERFSDFGVISCLTNSIGGTATTCGVLYMEIDLDLEEFCPISTTRPAMVKRLKSKLNAIELRPYRKPEEEVDKPKREVSCNC